MKYFSSELQEMRCIGLGPGHAESCLCSESRRPVNEDPCNKNLNSSHENHRLRLAGDSEVGICEILIKWGQ